MEGRPLDESDLIERSRGGDTRAYEQLVERYAHMAFRTAYLITASAADAEDASQEAFVRAFRALPRFRPGSAFRPWLLEIVANQARNQRRSAARRAGLALRVIEGFRTGGAAPSPEAEAEAAEEREQLLRAINTLGRDDRLVIACRYFLDLSVEETARVMRRPTGTVKSRLSRALQRVRTLLEATHG